MTAGLQGLDAWRRRLEALPADIKTELEREVDRSANDIATLAKAYVPVETGKLRDSITVTPGDTPTGRKVTADFPAKFVELGTKPHTVGGKFRRRQASGQQAAPVPHRGLSRPSASDPVSHVPGGCAAR